MVNDGLSWYNVPTGALPYVIPKRRDKVECDDPHRNFLAKKIITQSYALPPNDEYRPIS